MPVRPLEPKVVEYLKKNSRRIAAGFGDLPSVDHRRPGRSFSRVRLLDLSGAGLPGPKEVVIKRMHEPFTVEGVISEVNARVALHNERHGREPQYELVAPKVHDIGSGLIAMELIDAPAVSEILTFPTERGERFIEGYMRSQGCSRELAKKRFAYAAAPLEARTSFGHHNVLVLGHEKGRFRFMPLPDLPDLEA